jgi:hypothetical protein
MIWLPKTTDNVFVRSLLIPDDIDDFDSGSADLPISKVVSLPLESGTENKKDQNGYNKRLLGRACEREESNRDATCGQREARDWQVMLEGRPADHSACERLPSPFYANNPHITVVTA